MSTPTQKTALYVYDESGTPDVVQIGCPTSISGAGSTNESIETTCLSDDSRTYIPGLSSPGEVSFDVLFDTGNTSHMLLEEMRKNRTTTAWAIGFSDGTGDPTYATDKLTFTGRSSIGFTGFITSVEFGFEQNSVVSASIGIQITGDVAVEAAA